ncbi:MAG: GNAT family N-acetyltransferase [Desulfurococcales archaeon]|nr:GNAT family N-acetyltransferase [Desulfurococcales archaeon]
MASRVAVRRAQERDVESVAGLIARLKALNGELDPHFLPAGDLEARAREYVAKSLGSDNAFILVAEDEQAGRIVGVIRVELVDRVFYKPRIKAVITDFYVHPAYRGKRIGRLLVEKAQEEAKARGAGLITAVYPEGNIIADSFYSRMGFRPLQKELYKPL